MATKLPASAHWLTNPILVWHTKWETGGMNVVGSNTGRNKRSELFQAVAASSRMLYNKSGQSIHLYVKNVAGHDVLKTITDVNGKTVDLTKLQFKDGFNFTNAKPEPSKQYLAQKQQNDDTEAMLRQLHELSNAYSHDTDIVAEIQWITSEAKHAKQPDKYVIVEMGLNKVKNMIRQNYSIEAGTEDSSYRITVSVAYMANSIFDVQLKKEPWLHAREIRLIKFDNGKFVQASSYWVVYIWDTREIVQFVEDKRTVQQRPKLDEQMKRYVKAVDNAQPLKDPSHLVPNWAMQKLSRKSDLYSMSNEPKDVQDRYYNR